MKLQTELPFVWKVGGINVICWMLSFPAPFLLTPFSVPVADDVVNFQKACKATKIFAQTSPGPGAGASITSQLLLELVQELLFVFCFTAVVEKGQKSIRNLVFGSMLHWFHVALLLQTLQFLVDQSSRRPPKVQSRWCWRWRSSRGRTWPRLRMEDVTKYPTIVLG